MLNMLRRKLQSPTERVYHQSSRVPDGAVENEIINIDGAVCLGGEVGHLI